MSRDQPKAVAATQTFDDAFPPTTTLQLLLESSLRQEQLLVALITILRDVYPEEETRK